MAQFGKRKVRPEELAMCQLKKGFSVELNPILNKNIERSGRIMGELVDGRAERVTNTDVRCPCCEKRVGLTRSGLLTGSIKES